MDARQRGGQMICNCGKRLHQYIGKQDDGLSGVYLWNCACSQPHTVDDREPVGDEWLGAVKYLRDLAAGLRAMGAHMAAAERSVRAATLLAEHTERMRGAAHVTA